MKITGNFSYMYMKKKKGERQSLAGMPLVFLDKVKVVPAHDDGPIHLGTMACAGHDTTPD